MTTVNPSTLAATEPSLAVSIGKMHLANPLMTASGTCGYANEYADYTDLTKFGAFVTKAISKTPRKGNEPYRVVETRAGMLNAIGLANIGIDAFLRDKIPLLKAMNIPIIVNVPGWCTEDYVDVAARLDQEETVQGIELNVSCPNVKNGLSFGTDPQRLFDLVSAVRKVTHRCELIVKLSPNIADIALTAKAAVDAGATCLSLVNTFTAMAIDIERQRPVLANGTGGLSGPAIKPIALFLVHRVYTQVAKKYQIPIIGMGGIQRWQDAVEFLLAGATGLAVGTALFLDPNIPLQIIDGLKKYLAHKHLPNIHHLIGTLQPPAPH
ncbi:MAG: dihydroorotate dehydrogenase [Phycisphaerales bacterium]|nr:dihydroorotate dehydrogenase [Phycisphaerales bacterium]